MARIPAAPRPWAALPTAPRSPEMAGRRRPGNPQRHCALQSKGSAVPDYDGIREGRALRGARLRRRPQWRGHALPSDRRLAGRFPQRSEPGGSTSAAASSSKPDPPDAHWSARRRRRGRQRPQSGLTRPSAPARSPWARRQRLRPPPRKAPSTPASGKSRRLAAAAPMRPRASRSRSVSWPLPHIRDFATDAARRGPKGPRFPSFVADLVEALGGVARGLPRTGVLSCDSFDHSDDLVSDGSVCDLDKRADQTGAFLRVECPKGRHGPASEDSASSWVMDRISIPSRSIDARQGVRQGAKGEARRLRRADQLPKPCPGGGG